MTNQRTKEKGTDSSKRRQGRYKVAGSGAASTEYEMIVVDENGEKVDRFLYRKIPQREGGFVGHSIQLDAHDQVQTGNVPVRVAETGDGAPPDSSHILRSGSGVAGDQMVFWQGEDGQCHYTHIQDVPTGDEIRAEALPDSALRTDMSSVSSRIKRLPDEDLVEVTTKEGISAKVQRDKGLLTMGGDGELRKICPAEMVEGETLIPRAQPAVPYGTGPHFLELETRTGRGKQLRIPLDREAGFLFGMYVAEGSAAGLGHKNISFGAGEKQLRKRVESVLNGWGLKTGSNADAVWTTCTALGSKLAETCGKGAANKRIPDILWTAPSAFRDGFISGYFSGDGTVNGGEISASTASRELAEGIIFLLGSIGVRASYRTYNQSGKESYFDQRLIKVYQGGVENLPTLALTRKQKTTLEIQNSETKFSRDRIPVPDALKTETVRVIRESDQSHSIYTTGYTSRPQLKHVYSDLPDRMQELVDAPIWWELVDSVEKLDPAQHCYDLEMEQRSNFMIGAGLLGCSTTQGTTEVSNSASER